MAVPPMDTRVQDYLNDKLQTSSDLDTLDFLIQDVQTQQALLKQQVHHLPYTLSAQLPAHSSYFSSETHAPMSRPPSMPLSRK